MLYCRLPDCPITRPSPRFQDQDKHSDRGPALLTSPLHLPPLVPSHTEREMVSSLWTAQAESPSRGHLSPNVHPLDELLPDPVGLWGGACTGPGCCCGLFGQGIWGAGSPERGVEGGTFTSFSWYIPPGLQNPSPQGGAGLEEEQSGPSKPGSPGGLGLRVFMLRPSVLFISVLPGSDS